jgi:hypothetical protein
MPLQDRHGFTHFKRPLGDSEHTTSKPRHTLREMFSAGEIINIGYEGILEYKVKKNIIEIERKETQSKKRTISFTNSTCLLSVNKYMAFL